MKKSILDDSGFALLTTLLLGTLSLGLIATAFYMTTTSTSLLGVERRYNVELDSAKGASGFVMAEIRSENLQCDSANPGPCVPDPTPDVCQVTSQVILNPLLCDKLGRSNACTGLSACYMSEDIIGITTFYSVRVTSVSNNGESAIIDFVYKTE